jgi:alginate production protein
MHYLRLTPMLLAVLALASPAQTAPAPAAVREPASRDERRPEQPWRVDVFGQSVELGGSWEYSDERRRNFDLDDARARDRRVREHEVKLEARMRLDADTHAFAQIVGLHETRRTQGDGRRVTHALERGQMWLQQDRIGGTPWSLQAGRVELLDRRAWWWDEDLDAIRARYDGGTWRLDTGVARELLRKSSADSGVVPAARGVTRGFGQATWPWAPRHALDAFWLLHNDGSSRPASGAVFRDEDATDPSDLRARWLGLRASGEWRIEDGPRLTYWADTAWLSGREHLSAFDEQPDGTFSAAGESRRKVRGTAFDIGATASLALPLRPSLTVGYARGSSGFRQSGLQENKARLGGVKRWQRYGELVQPELANLSVASLGAGVRVLENSSIELVAHRLRQVRASDRLAGSRLSADPQGSNRNLGREVNLLVAVRENKRIEFTFKASVFKPGTAFAPDERKPARAVEFGVTVNF